MGTVMLPVFVQAPNKPKKKLRIGLAAEDADALAVAEKCGVPKSCFLSGKVIRSKKGTEAYWSIIAFVKFG